MQIGKNTFKDHQCTFHKGRHGTVYMLPHLHPIGGFCMLCKDFKIFKLDSHSTKDYTRSMCHWLIHMLNWHTKQELADNNYNFEKLSK